MTMCSRYLRRLATVVGLGLWSVCAEVTYGEEPKLESTYKESFDADRLAKEYPPQLTHPNKKIVFEVACPAGTVEQGSVTVSRWKSAALPERFPEPAIKIAVRPGYFTYDAPKKGVAAWHLNFADPRLFGYYGGGLLAQDELQVAEHPLLASVREALLAKKLPALTVENGVPTPVLVQDVARRGELQTDPDAAAGRPEGLYGKRFALANGDVVRKATRRIDPPTRSNILAMAAPHPGRGPYTRAELTYVLTAAYTGFRAAKELSGDAEVEIHTGFWGCGAFGGNRTVMTALQIAAARAAGVNLVFHVGDKSGEKDFAKGQEAWDKLAAPEVSKFLDNLEKAAYEWNRSDGN